MDSTTLLHEFITESAMRSPRQVALIYGEHSVDYGELARQIAGFASGMMMLGLTRSERVAIFLEKRVEMVVAAFGTSSAGGTFVPVNPLLKPDQVAYILRDC